MKAFALIQDQPDQQKKHSYLIFNENFPIHICEQAIKQPKPKTAQTHVIDIRKQRVYSLEEHCVGVFKKVKNHKIYEQKSENAGMKNKPFYHHISIFSKLKDSIKKERKEDAEKSQSKESSFNRQMKDPQLQIEVVDKKSDQQSSINGTIVLEPSFQKFNEEQLTKFHSRPRINKETGQAYRILPLKILKKQNQNKSIDLSNISVVSVESFMQKQKLERKPIFKKTQKKESNRSSFDRDNNTNKKIHRKIFDDRSRIRPNYSKTVLLNSPSIQQQRQQKSVHVSLESQQSSNPPPLIHNPSSKKSTSTIKQNQSKIHRLKSKKYSENSNMSQQGSSHYKQQIFKINPMSRVPSSSSSISIQVISYNPMPPFKM